jgi:hypothetical protein
MAMVSRVSRVGGCVRKRPDGLANLCFYKDSDHLTGDPYVYRSWHNTSHHSHHLFFSPSVKHLSHSPTKPRTSHFPFCVLQGRGPQFILRSAAAQQHCLDWHAMRVPLRLHRLTRMSDSPSTRKRRPTCSRMSHTPVGSTLTIFNTLEKDPTWKIQSLATCRGMVRR